VGKGGAGHEGRFIVKSATKGNDSNHRAKSGQDGSRFVAEEKKEHRKRQDVHGGSRINSRPPKKKKREGFPWGLGSARA